MYEKLCYDQVVAFRLFIKVLRKLRVIGSLETDTESVFKDESLYSLTFVGYNPDKSILNKEECIFKLFGEF